MNYVSGNYGRSLNEFDVSMAYGCESYRHVEGNINNEPSWDFDESMEDAPLVGSVSVCNDLGGLEGDDVSLSGESIDNPLARVY